MLFLFCPEGREGSGRGDKGSFPAPVVGRGTGTGPAEARGGGRGEGPRSRVPRALLLILLVDDDEEGEDDDGGGSDDDEAERAGGAVLTPVMGGTANGLGMPGRPRAGEAPLRKVPCVGDVDRSPFPLSRLFRPTVPPLPPTRGLNRGDLLAGNEWSLLLLLLFREDMSTIATGIAIS